MSGNNHWTKRKPGVVIGTPLSLEQQQILAAVPRWKKEWVRPSTLKQGQNPNFKILKWVIDNSQGESEGTEEEMQAALQEVTAGNVPLPSDPAALASVTATATATGTPTPAATSQVLSLAGTPAPQPVPPAVMQSAANPIAAVQHSNANKPVAEQAPTVGGAEGTVAEAVRPMEDVKMEDAIDKGGEVKPEERSLAM
ncbi:hypothetical protein JCM10207_006475 [Rhodosporidiobolus poonsookiae]